MHTCRRFMFYICAGLLTVAAVSGCGGSSTNETIPTTVTIFNSHSLIFRNNSAMTLGYNAFGQLGDNTLENRAVATKVSGLGHMTGGAAGAEHTLAFSNHTSVVMAWGYNAYGQLGNPSVLTSINDGFSRIPVSAQLERPVTGVAAGAFHSLGVANGSVWTWGDNSNGQLGDGDDRPGKSNKPTKLTKDMDDLPLPARTLQVAGGGLHSLALFDDGSVYAWGSNAFGQVGTAPGTTATIYKRPKKVAGLPTITQIAAGNKFNLALEEVRVGGVLTEQRLWAWGYGAFGQIGQAPADLTELTAGNANTAYSATPTVVPGTSVTVLDGDTEIIKAISAGLDHTLLLVGGRDHALGDSTHKVLSFGFNFYGQLGNNMLASPTGKETTVSSFELVYTLSFSGSGEFTGVSDIAAFGDHSLAKVGGVWYGWGNNDMGQLGNPAPTSSAGNPKIPVRVQGL